jgi:hypothetical protein
MTLAIAAFVTSFVLGIVPTAQADEHKECSSGSLKGSFGFTSTGTLLALPPPLAGPFGEVGRQTFDGQGNTDATATLSANGNIVRVTVQGTYEFRDDKICAWREYFDTSGVAQYNQIFPLTGDFLKADHVLSSNPRVIQMALKFSF